MKQIYNYLIIPVALLLLLLSSGCSNNSVQKNNQGELKIAAASDLNLAFTEIGKVFEEKTGANITFSFGSTGQLADQIENGAPFDIFAAANIQFIDNLVKKEMVISDTQKTYAFGRVGIASLKDRSFSLESMQDLLKPEIKKIAIANPDHAPYGLAAKQALIAAGIWDGIKGKLVYGRNISDTLTFIETGNAEAGIIALSLNKDDEFNFHLIEEEIHAPLEQSVAVIRGTKHEQLSRDFIDFIKGPIGKPIMESYGFHVPEEN